MKEISTALKGRIQRTFGWGTNLTNDLGFKPLPIVVKPVRAAGHEVVKLPDNVEKATGSPEAIGRRKRLVGYTNTFGAECKY